MKIELKYNQRLFLNWVLLWKYKELPQPIQVKIVTAMSEGFYNDGGESQRHFNILRSEYIKTFVKFEDFKTELDSLTDITVD